MTLQSKELSQLAEDCGDVTAHLSGFRLDTVTSPSGHLELPLDTAYSR